jgi:hypothetical protein
MNFNFDKNLKIAIVEEAINKNELDLYRVLTMAGYVAEDFVLEEFEPNADSADDLEIQKMITKRNNLVQKLQELNS